MPDFQPLHSAHAIEQVAFSVTFHNPLDDATLQAAKNAIGNPEELPGRMELRQIAIAIGAGAPAPTSGAALSNGYAFTKIQADGAVETELQLLRNAVVFRTNLYTRWAAVWDRARKYFSCSLEIYARRSALAQVSLNYLDKFVCYGSLQEARVATVLQPNSPYIAPRIFGASDLWHCHSGAFSRANDRTKRLTTVNLDYLTETMATDGRERQTLSIMAILADMLNQPGYAPTQPPAERLISVVDEAFQALHQADKVILGSIISPEMARRIALEG